MLCSKETERQNNSGHGEGEAGLSEGHEVGQQDDPGHEGEVVEDRVGKELLFSEAELTAML